MSRVTAGLSALCLASFLMAGWAFAGQESSSGNTPGKIQRSTPSAGFGAGEDPKSGPGFRGDKLTETEKLTPEEAKQKGMDTQSKDKGKQ